METVSIVVTLMAVVLALTMIRRSIDKLTEQIEAIRRNESLPED